MRRRYFFVTCEVANRSRDAQDTLMRPRRQVESFGGSLEQCPTLVRGITRRAQLIAAQACITLTALFHLSLPGIFYSSLHHFAPLATHLFGAQRFRRWTQHLNVKINPIQQRPGNFSPIGCDLITTTTAIRQTVPKVSAGARVHCRNQLKLRWILGVATRSGNANAPELHRFA